MRSPRAGFALVYVLWVVATASMLLLDPEARTGGDLGAVERRLAGLRAEVELDATLAYVRARLVDREVPLAAPAAAAYAEARARRVARARENPDLRQAVRDLRTILSQLEFEADFLAELETPGAATAGTVTGAGTGPGVDADGAPGRITLERAFTVRQAPQRFTVGPRRYALTVHPTAAWPNLNTLDADALARVLAHHGVAPDRARTWAARIADWRDADPTARPGGADHLAYGAAGYRPRDGALGSWAELAYLDLPGAPPLDWWRARFTLHGAHRRVALAYIDDGLLAALADLSRADAAAARAGFDEDGESGVRAALAQLQAERFLAAVGPAPRDPRVARLTLTHPAGMAARATVDLESGALLAHW